MEKKTKIPQVYGYAVCIVAIITVLISVTTLINSVIDASDPLYAWGDNQRLSSFENFKVDALKSGKDEASYVPNDETLRVMYEDAKNHKIRRVKHQTTKSMIVSSILIVISVTLFIIHWRWMRKVDKQQS
jgi:hypothetical protein